MKTPLMEACVDSLPSALTAQRAGADRLELCGHLPIGGVTPSSALFRQIRRDCGIPIHVLIRPRFGDFLYDPDELEQMAREIELFRDLGADGMVLGVLTPQGEVDRAAMEKLMDRAGSLPITLHRAFDMTRDPFAALEDAVGLGCAAILTSGQAENVTAGQEKLRLLHGRADGRIQIMAGCGVNRDNILPLHGYTGITAFHASCRRVLPSGMEYRKEGVSMGLPSLSEYDIWRTDEEEMRACAGLVHSL